MPDGKYLKLKTAEASKLHIHCYADLHNLNTFSSVLSIQNKRITEERTTHTEQPEDASIGKKFNI